MRTIEPADAELFENYCGDSYRTDSLVSIPDREGNLVTVATNGKIAVGDHSIHRETCDDQTIESVFVGELLSRPEGCDDVGPIPYPEIYGHVEFREIESECPRAPSRETVKEAKITAQIVRVRELPFSGALVAAAIRWVGSEHSAVVKNDLLALYAGTRFAIVVGLRGIDAVEKTRTVPIHAPLIAVLQLPFRSRRR